MCARHAHPLASPRRALRAFVPGFRCQSSRNRGHTFQPGSHTGHYEQACGAGPAPGGRLTLTALLPQVVVHLLGRHVLDEAIFLGDRVLVMSARPGHIKFDEHVPLPRPRSADLVTDPTFIALKRRLLAVIESESIKAFAAMNQVAVASAV